MAARRKLKKTVKRKKPPASTEVQEPLSMPTIDEADPQRGRVKASEEKIDRTPKNLRGKTKLGMRMTLENAPDMPPPPALDDRANQATAKALSNMALSTVGIFTGAPPTDDEIATHIEAMEGVLKRYGGTIPHIELISLAIITMVTTLNMYQRGREVKKENAGRSNDSGTGKIGGGQDGTAQADDRAPSK